jgi:LmbE family N-acetylglucosaminyl deacetylase
MEENLGDQDCCCTINGERLLPLFQEFARNRPLKILCLGAHSDDIEIGCGGTILKLCDHHPGSQFQWVVFSAAGQRRTEAIKSARLFLKKSGRHKVVTHSFRDSYFPAQYEKIKNTFEDLKHEIDPDVVLTHFRHDLHQDHRVICELTWNTFRNHLVLEYEIPKWDGDLGSPNFFVSLSEAACCAKCYNLLEVFGSQRNKTWFTEDTFRALMRIRGVECNASEKYAEAFYCRKLIV